MVAERVTADAIHVNLTAVALTGLGVVLATRVLTVDDMNLQGGTRASRLELPVERAWIHELRRRAAGRPTRGRADALYVRESCFLGRRRGGGRPRTSRGVRARLFGPAGRRPAYHL